MPSTRNQFVVAQVVVSPPYHPEKAHNKLKQNHQSMRQLVARTRNAVHSATV